MSDQTLQDFLAGCSERADQLRATRDDSAIKASSERLRKLTISTSCVCPPIPDRSFDWSAIDSSTYAGEGSPQGRGATEQEAIDDLLQQLDIQI
jgi:hypothetical protein